MTIFPTNALNEEEEEEKKNARHFNVFAARSICVFICVFVQEEVKKKLNIPHSVQESSGYNVY